MSSKPHHDLQRTVNLRLRRSTKKVEQVCNKIWRCHVDLGWESEASMRQQTRIYQSKSKKLLWIRLSSQLGRKQSPGKQRLISEEISRIKSCFNDSSKKPRSIVQKKILQSWLIYRSRGSKPKTNFSLRLLTTSKRQGRLSEHSMLVYVMSNWSKILLKKGFLQVRNKRVSSPYRYSDKPNKSSL